MTRSQASSFDSRARSLFTRFRHAFDRYAAWLVSISWKRFLLLSFLLLMFSGILQSLPPFTWRTTQTIVDSGVERPAVNRSPPAPKPDDDKIVIALGSKSPTPPTEAGTSADAGGVSSAARAALAEAIAEAREAALADTNDSPGPRRVRTTTTSLGEGLPELAFLWILGSAIIKFTYKGRMHAEAQAAVATETAEAETLKRQVVEARMAAMQAQIEPHFLFNTLASIDHLIETDPPRASRMQKNLIALLRASMPTLRESNHSGLRDLGAEIGVIQPYLEILKVRMEDRLDAHIDVPEGLKSAAFPPMMLQSLVENAIKHGLEPKAEGGALRVKAEIVHGKLVVSVSDTGLGFGRAATAGTGVGLVNVRERLKLLFGAQAALVMTANQPAGTVATITVPYRSLDMPA